MALPDALLAAPFWRRAMPWLVGLSLALTLLLDVVAPALSGKTWWWQTAVAVAVLGAAWALELGGQLGGRRLPRPLFALAVTVPAAVLNVAREGSISLLFAMLLVGWVGYRDTRREGLVVLGIALAGALSYLLDRDVEGWLGISVGIVAALVSVWAIRSQQELVAVLRAAQRDLARQAAAAERRRIAGEVHDVAAHSLAVTMLHLTGARLLVQRQGGDPRVVAALAEAERLGRRSLDDVRRTVGLLDEETPAEGDCTSLSPLPGAGDVTALVEEFRAAGMRVRLRSGVDAGALPETAGLTLYRILQEALANAVKHAPGAAVEVELTRERGAVALRVRDSGAAPEAPQGPASDGGTGYGISGMRQRVALLGGTLTAGPAPDGAPGWEVRCLLPLAGVPVEVT